MSKPIKEKLSNIFCIILFIGIIAYLIIPGIYSLASKKNNYRGTILYATQILEMEHSINGLIPVGTEYYYMGMTSDATVVVFRAKKDWLDGKFDEQGYAMADQGVEIEGEQKRLSVKVYASVYDCAQQLGDSKFAMNLHYCVDILYEHYAIMGIVDGILLLIVAIFIYLLIKLKLPFKINSKISAIILLLALAAVLMFTLHILYIR